MPGISNYFLMVAGEESKRVCIYNMLYRYNDHSINKVNIASRVGNRKHCLVASF